VCGGQQRVGGAGDVGAGGGQGDVELAEEDAGQGLGLEVGQGFPLPLGELPDLPLRKPDVVQDGGRVAATARRMSSGPSRNEAGTWPSNRWL
jgi:hypothetical protein